MSLNAVVVPIFQQLGILDQLLAITLPIPHRYMFDHNLNPVGSVQMPDLTEQYVLCLEPDLRFPQCPFAEPLSSMFVPNRVGCPFLAVDRPSLYNLLLSMVPPECVLFNKRITNMSEYIGGVSVSCGTDKEMYHGDILVGADGIHSAVRQIMFKRLEELHKLPEEDIETPTRGYITVLGTTRTLDPERFKNIPQSYSEFSQIYGHKCPYTVSPYLVDFEWVIVRCFFLTCRTLSNICLVDHAQRSG